MLDKEIRKIKYLVEDECNIKSGDIDGSTRKRKVVLARMVLCNFLMFEVGLKESTLIHHVKRDRTLFFFYKKQHNAYIKNVNIYPEYIDLYNKIKTRYYNLDDNLFDGTDKNQKLENLSLINDELESLMRKKIVLIDEIKILE